MSEKVCHLMRRTKIVATLGPACDDPNMLTKIIREGVNVVRLNFSHGKPEDHQRRIEAVRGVAQELGRVVGILADLQGPKIRVANFKNGKVILKDGAAFTLDATWPSDQGDEHCVGIDYKDLPRDVCAQDCLLLDDGRLSLTVLEVKGPAIHCRVDVGGELSNHKGINKRGGGLSAPALTDKDKSDLVLAVKWDVDYIAISFPRDAKDVEYAKQLVKENNGTAGIIAKIERKEAVDHIDDIIKASDGVMVARGDLAVEIGDAEVPWVQKEIIHRARTLDKPVIVATQMMESMVHSTVPTRAEVSDVANAVLDNADAVMLSAESATGEYPDRTVAAVSRVCMAVEKQPKTHTSGHRVECRFQRVDEAIAMAAMYVANHLDITAVLALTESGMTALWMSRIRSGLPIYALSRFPRTLGKMSLYRGVFPVYFDVTQFSLEAINRESVAIIRSKGLVDKDDLVVLTKGDHLGVGGGSNALKILRVGEVGDLS